MAYHDIANLSQDTAFVRRVSACYAVETLGSPTAEEPNGWAYAHSWAMAAQPGFGDAYAYAVANGNPSPGSDPAVITDAQILSAVQSLMAPAAP